MMFCKKFDTYTRLTCVSVYVAFVSIFFIAPGVIAVAYHFFKHQRHIFSVIALFNFLNNDEISTFIINSRLVSHLTHSAITVIALFIRN